MDKSLRPSLTAGLEKKLAEIVRDLGTSKGEKEFWDDVVTKACDALAAESGTFFGLSSDGKELLVVSSHGILPKTLSQAHFPVSKGICGWIVRNRQIACVNDVKADARFNSEVDVVTEFKTLAVLGAPVAVPQRLYGVLEILNPQQRPFTSSHSEFLEALGGAAGMLFHRLNLSDKK